LRRCYRAPGGWATTIPGRFEAGADPPREGREPYNHRIYVVTTKDFETFSEAKLCYDFDFSVIDSTVVRSGDRYVMFLKDETERPAQKNIRIATSDAATGPFTKPSEPITGRYWAEGPTAVRIGDKWFVYFDKYTDHRYGMVTSGDPISDDPGAWRDESEKLEVPGGMRHGTAFAAPAEVVERLLELE
jgi:hypothetical protein